MLLLIDASRANNEQKTGVEWYAHFVIQELKKIVLPEVKVILYVRESLKGELAKLPANWSEKVLSWPPRRLWTQLRLSWEMLKYRRRADVVLFVPAHVLPFFTTKKTFTTIHDLGGFSFPAGYSWFEKWYTKLAIRRALQKATIFVPSEFIKREIEYFFSQNIKYKIQNKITVVSNGFDKETFQLIVNQEKIKSILKKYQIQQPYFLSISRLEEKKNTAGIVEGFEIFKTKNCPLVGELKTRFSLVLLGKPGFGFKKIKKIIEESKYKNDFIHPGWVEQADVPYLISGAEAFVFPSFYEGFGIPVLEALACGVPVIASAVSSLPEVAGGAALLVDPQKPAEIATAMSVIISSPNLKEDLIKKGLMRVKNFSWEKTAQDIWQVLSAV